MVAGNFSTTFNYCILLSDKKWIAYQTIWINVSIKTILYDSVIIIYDNTFLQILFLRKNTKCNSKKNIGFDSFLGRLNFVYLYRTLDCYRYYDVDIFPTIQINLVGSAGNLNFIQRVKIYKS